MCPVWWKALTSKCDCGREEVELLSAHEALCLYRTGWSALLSKYPDLETHEFYTQMYKDMMGE